MKANSPRRFFNREMSWLFFNSRVLEEAKNTDIPLLERVRFLSISASNLDEFYMVRVAGLRTQILAGMNDASFDGYKPRRQIEKIAKRVRKITKVQTQCWHELRKELRKDKISVRKISDLSQESLEALKQIYQNRIFPLLSPLTIDPAHPFPFIPNLGFGMALELKRKSRKEVFHALIPIPTHVPRFIQLGRKGREFILIEDVLEHFSAELFPDFEIRASGVFRITRDSDLAIDEEAEDLVRHFEFLLKKRRRGRVIRLEMNDTMVGSLKEFLIDSFECWDEDIHHSDGMLGMRALSELVQTERSDLLFPPFKARFPERIREFDGDCFAAIAAKDILVHHPYEEFEVVVQFLQQAALDHQVVAIKQTLYRTSEDSPIVKALIEAAERGKNVMALVELKARFDEETNLRWARDLERAGAQVVYGFIDYKTHAKVSLVIRDEPKGLQTYTHLGTGNYHAQNAKVYTDLALFTNDRKMGEDVGKLFNYVTSYSQPRDLNKLVVAPLNLRETLISLIDNEIKISQAGGTGSIWVKLNALVDEHMIDKLYEASQAGVQIDLIIRGICCLRPNVEGLSENIRVKSIIGRFLEHSRIVCFGNGTALPNSKAKIFFSSADWMPRNLNRRIETLVPVEATTVRNQIMNQIMVANLIDDTNSWDLMPTGKYIRRNSGDAPFSAHEYFMKNPSLSGRGKALKLSAPVKLNVPVRGKKKDV